MTRTMTVTVRSQQLNTRSSDKLWLREKDRLKSTLLRQSERPERLCWTWVIRRWLTESRGWSSRLFRRRIAQGLKDDEEVEKTTLSETLNTASSTFKFFTVKQIFPREPYRLKIHRDALYVPKPPGDHGVSDNKAPSSYQMSHRTSLDTEELARRSAIYASLADSMVASVIEELSSKDECYKLLREKLAIIQEAQVSAVSAGFAAASNLQLLHRDALLKNFKFQPQVLSSVRTAPFEGSHVVGPEPKVLQNRVHPIRQADRMAGSSVTFDQKNQEPASMKVMSSKKTEGPVHDHSKEARSLARLFLLPLPDNVDGSQVGARLADFAPHWRSLLGNCRTTGIVEDGVGFAFQQRPQLTHQSISFRTRNSRQDLQQAVDDFADEGSHRAGLQRDETFVMPTFMFRCIRLSASICVSWSTRRCTSSLVFRLNWRPIHESSPGCCQPPSRCLGSKMWSYTST